MQTFDTRSFDRRKLLAGGALALGTLATPVEVARAFAEALQAPADDSPLDRAVRRARARGKPVLVIVVPETTERQRGLIEFLEDLSWLGWDGMRYPLALVEVACATSEQLAIHCGRVHDALGLLELEGRPRWTRIEVDLERFVEPLESRRERAREGFLSVLAGDLAIAERRARECARALGPQRMSEVERALAKGDGERDSIALELVDDGAALFHLVERGEPAARRRWAILLFRAAHARVQESPPLGARWCVHQRATIHARPVQVSYLPEDDKATRYLLSDRAVDLAPPPPAESVGCMGPCGTGSSGLRGSRFLVFYTEESG